MWQTLQGIPEAWHIPNTQEIFLDLVRALILVGPETCSYFLIHQCPLWHISVWAGLTPVILVIRKAKIRRISGQIVRETVTQKTNKQKNITRKGWWSGSTCRLWVQTPVPQNQKQNQWAFIAVSPARQYLAPKSEHHGKRSRVLCTPD
jgi:hypothetical protein